MSEEIE
jgi:hypothetical protein